VAAAAATAAADRYTTVAASATAPKRNRANKAQIDVG